MSMIHSEDRAEFIGQIIDVFEDFLDEKEIFVPNSEREEDKDFENRAIIYGTDYSNIQDKLESLMRGWDLIE